MIKKFLAIGTFSLMSVTLTFAQKGKVNSAEYNLSTGDVVKAKENIDEAFSSPDMLVFPKAWIIKGDVYKTIYDLRATNKDLYSATPDALTTAKDAYLKAFEVEVNPKKKKDVKEGLASVGANFYNEGIASFTNSNWEDAFNKFKNTLSISEFLYNNQIETVIDTQAYFVVLLSAFNSHHFKDAISAGEKLISLNDDRDVIYTVLIDAYKQTGEQEKYENTIAQARAKFPNNIDILLKEINLYLEKGKIDELEGKLKEAITLDANNPSLYQALANVYDKKGNEQGAFDMYDKAIATKPDYYEAYYNKAILYFNKAMEVVERMNEESDMKKYDLLKAQRLELLENKALPLFLKAYSLAPDDANVIKALKEIYARLDMFDEIKKLGK
ncbi:MAG: hypothetical protein M9888_06915 [Chitinophagales bacterium]|nr:hypothetical protein [Chitinophagales bacterium]